MSKEILIGLDGEMTGNDHSREKLPHRLIQVGASLNVRTTFVCDIGWKGGSFDWEEQAAAVHNIPLSRVTSLKALTSEQVDSVFSEWLQTVATRHDS